MRRESFRVYLKSVKIEEKKWLKLMRKCINNLIKSNYKDKQNGKSSQYLQKL